MDYQRSQDTGSQPPNHSQTSYLFLPLLHPAPDKIQRIQLLTAPAESRIASARNQLQDIRNEISQLKKKQKELEYKIQQEELYVRQMNRSLAPYFPCKLPSEILARIFIQFVGDTGNPWIIAQTCRIWRKVARSTQQLWGRLNLTVNCHDWSDGPYRNRRYSNGRENCRSYGDVEAALLRAGSAPLDIVAHFPDWDWRSGPAEDDKEALRDHLWGKIGLHFDSESDEYSEGDLIHAVGLREDKMWDMLVAVGGPRAAQWTHIAISIGWMKRRNFQDWFRHPMQLECLSIDELSSPMFDALDQAPSPLRKLQIGDCCDGPELKLLANRRCLAGVQSLNMGFWGQDKAVLDLIRPMGFLESLTLRFRGKDSPSAVLFGPDNLTSLQISSHEAWIYTFLTSSLTHLELNHEDNRIYGAHISPEASISLPKLVTLKIWNQLLLKTISILQCPVLQELHLYGLSDAPQASGDDFLSTFIEQTKNGICLINPHSLTIKPFACSPATSIAH